MGTRRWLVAWFVGLLVSGPVLAEDVPHIITCQGRLTDATGVVVPDDTYKMIFNIYDVQAAGTALWTESRDVPVSDGLFTVEIGAMTPIPPALASDHSTLWLGIKVGGDPELPRVRMSSGAFTFHAVRSDTATHVLSPVTNGWTDTGTRVTLATGFDSVGIGTLTPAAKLHVMGDIQLRSGDDIRFGSADNAIITGSDQMTLVTADDIFLTPHGDLNISSLGLINIRDYAAANWMRIDPGNKRVGIGTANPSEMLHIFNANPGSPGAFLKIETAHGTQWYEAGLRIETPEERWHLRMDDYTHNNLPGGALGLRSNSHGEVMTWNVDGKVGIGTTTPQQMLHVADNLKVNDTSYTGVLGVGVTTAQRPLHVAGDALIGDTLFPGALSADCVNAKNIIDEPGFVSKVQNGVLNLTSSWQAMDTVQIAVPGPGYVLGIGTGDVSISMDAFLASYTSVGVSTSPTGLAGAQDVMVHYSDEVEGSSYTPITCQWVWPVPSAGTYTYYHIARKASDGGTASFHHGILTVVYIPTSYAPGGAIVAPSLGHAGRPPDETAMTAAVERDGPPVEPGEPINVEAAIADLERRIQELRSLVESRKE